MDRFQIRQACSVVIGGEKVDKLRKYFKDLIREVIAENNGGQVRKGESEYCKVFATGKVFNPKLKGKAVKLYFPLEKEYKNGIIESVEKNRLNIIYDTGRTAPYFRDLESFKWNEYGESIKIVKVYN